METNSDYDSFINRITKLNLYLITSSLLLTIFVTITVIFLSPNLAYNSIIILVYLIIFGINYSVTNKIKKQQIVDFARLFEIDIDDNYDQLNSHFFPSLIRKIHEVKNKNKKELVLWGDGSPKREVIYVDDIADACVYFMNKKFKGSMINIGTGKDYSIKEYAKIILKLIIPNKKIKIKYDKSKPNGTPRKVMDVSLAKKYGWKSKIDLKKAIRLTYNDYLLKKR